MPELPEVHTMVSDLNRNIRGRKIRSAWFDWPKAIKRPTPAAFSREIQGSVVEGVRQRGKNILIDLNFGRTLLIHPKMTGHVLLGKWRVRKEENKHRVQSLVKGLLGEKVNNYIHLILYFEGGTMLGFSDARKFGKIILEDREAIALSRDLRHLGPDPLEVDFETFAKLFKNQKRKIKQVLMDQEVLSGIGNIYSDEMLWKARIHPLLLAKGAPPAKLKDLYWAMREVLKKAIKLRGTSTSDFRDVKGRPGGYTRVRFVYGREGEPCPRCGESIERRKIGGRSAHFCPKCQAER